MDEHLRRGRDPHARRLDSTGGGRRDHEGGRRSVQLDPVEAGIWSHGITEVGRVHACWVYAFKKERTRLANMRTKSSVHEEANVQHVGLLTSTSSAWSRCCEQVESARGVVRQQTGPRMRGILIKAMVNQIRIYVHRCIQPPDDVSEQAGTESI